MARPSRTLFRKSFGVGIIIETFLKGLPKNVSYLLDLMSYLIYTEQKSKPKYFVSLHLKSKIKWFLSYKTFAIKVFIVLEDNCCSILLLI